MPTSVLTRQRTWISVFAVLAMVISLMAITQPANAQVQDTSASCPDSIPSAGFTDLAGLDATTVQAIDCLAFYGISQGTSAITFSPTLSVPRWQMALFLTRQAEVHGVTLPDGSPQGFTDIGGLDAATQTAINQLAQLEITQGTSATTFSPFDLVSRWQMALFISRLVAAAGVTLPDGAPQGYGDIASLSVEAQTAINQVTQLGIAQGTSSTTFVPFAATLRWQMALFLTRTLAADGVTPTGLPGTSNTDAPELISVDEVSFDDDEEELVLEFTFDEDVFVEDSDMFLVYEADGTVHVATDADAASPEVEATFDIDEDEYELLTTAAVAANGVEATDDGLNNPEGSVGIGSATIESSTGDLDAPLVNLDDVDWEDRDLGLNTSEFTFEFDDEITVGDGDGGFAIILANGEDVVACTADGAQTSDDITVECPLSIASGDWARGWVDETILQGGDADLFQVADERSTDTPDLVSVNILSNDRAEFIFDEQVHFPGDEDDTDDLGAPGDVLEDFFVYDEDGNVVNADCGADCSAIIVNSNRTVRVQFADDAFDAIEADADLDDRGVGGFVNPGAVEERVGDELPNTFDEARIGAGSDTDVDSGTTLDPDLVSVGEPEVSSTDLEGDADEWEVVYTFDEDLVEGDDGDGVCDPEDFRGYTAEGEIVEGIACDVEDDEATVTFDDDDVEDMVLGGVGEGAVMADDNDDSNTVGSEPVS